MAEVDLVGTEELLVALDGEDMLETPATDGEITVSIVIVEDTLEDASAGIVELSFLLAETGLYVVEVFWNRASVVAKDGKIAE